MLRIAVFYIVMAGLPSFLLLRYFYRRDNRRAEPMGQIIRMFLLGCLTILPAIILEEVIMFFGSRIPSHWAAAFQAFAVAALVEEGVKFIVVRRRIFRMESFDEITDGLVYTIAAGLGFAFLENLLYGIDNFGNVSVLILRAVTAVPLHCMVSGLMGYYLGMSWYDRRRSGITGLLLAIGFHGAYDFVLFSENISAWWIIPVLILGYLLLFRLFRKAQKQDAKAGLS